MKTNAVIRVRFLPRQEGGRHKPVEGRFYACPLFVGGKGFDCRLILNGRRLELGTEYEVPVSFLNPDDVLSTLRPGVDVLLWEGFPVAKGVVVSVMGR